MREGPLDMAYLIRVPEGADLHSHVKRLLSELKVQGALLFGIGGLSRAKLGYFDFSSRSYVEKELDEQLELVSLLGNAALLDGEPHVHLHATLAGRDYRALAGHLLEARVHPFVELGILTTSHRAIRSFSEQKGLFLLLQERP